MSDNSNINNEKPLKDDNIIDDSLSNVSQNESTGNKAIKRGKSNTNKKTKKSVEPKRDSKARTASAAVFFNDNKAIAGFGNSMRSVFTSIRELVENSLDASEKRNTIPKIKLIMRRLSKKELDKLMGTSVVVKTKETRIDFIELSCRDNGVGVPRELIPQLFGTVLAGTKYGAQQTRGRFGLGSKMVLLHAMSTLDLPIQITTRPVGEDITYRIQLFIDLEKNAPIIHKDIQYVEGDEEHFDDYGTEIKVSFTGSWNLAKTYVREYFKQLAIITPYADIIAILPGDEKGVQDEYIFNRVVDDLPKPPQVIKIHPWGTDISTFRREMSHSDDEDLVSFLVNTFMGVNATSAKAFFDEVGVDSSKSPQDLTSPEIRRIVHDGFNRALKEAKTVLKKRDRVFLFDAPSGEALSPLGAERLRKGLEKELAPDFIEAITRSPQAYEGHPFIIEAAIGYGGGVNSAASSKGVTVIDNRVLYRYANRIPLIFGAGNDLITKVVNSINWSDYGLTRGTEPLAIAVSLVSTKIPFPETSKEYIDSVDEITEEVKLILMQLGRKLKTYLSRRRRRQRERQRKSRFEMYAPKTVENLLYILEKENMWNPTTGVSPSRIVAALASGKPRIGSDIIPYGDQLFQAPIWSTKDVVHKLQNNDIFELSSFLRHPNKKLAKILRWSVKEVDLVKRRTIYELDNKGEIPEINTDVMIDPEIEKRFHKKMTSDKIIELPRLSKAFSRRWVRNYYDYLVSPTNSLSLVHGLFVKLMEAEKFEVISGLAVGEEDEILLDDLSNLLNSLSDDPTPGFESFFKVEESIVDPMNDEKSVIESSVVKSTATQIDLSDVLPNLEDIIEIDIVKKRKITHLYDFLVETAHPSQPLDEKTLALDFVKIFKEKLLLLISQQMEIGNIRVDVVGQTWLDGYLRNAFKRRKISTVLELLAIEDGILAEIGEFQRTLYSNTMKQLIPEKSKIILDQFGSSDAKKKIAILKRSGINSIEQFLVTPSVDLFKNEKMENYFNILIDASKDKIIYNLTMQNKLGELQLLKIVPTEFENELVDLYLFSTIDFLRKPLHHFSDKFHERVIYAKQQIGHNFSGFTSTQQRLMKKLNIIVLEELIFHPNDYLTKELTDKDYKVLEKLISSLMKPVYYLEPHFLSSIDLLFDAGVTTIGKFIVWPTKILADILNYQEEWLNLMKENFDIKEIQDNEKEFSIDLDQVSHLVNPDEIAIIKEIGFETISEVSQIKWGDIFPNFGKWANISAINDILVGPIINISTLITEKKDSKLLETIITDLEKKKYLSVLQLLNSSSTALVSSLTSKKKRTLMESILTDLRNPVPEKIDVMSDIYKAIKIFYILQDIRSPLVYLSEFNTREVEILNQAGIQTLHQLVSTTKLNMEEIFHITNIDISGKLENSSMNTTGTPLFISDSKKNLNSVIYYEYEGVEYFQKDDISSLMKVGYNTIESLYYMSDRRTFEVSGLSWDVISHYKKLLQSPLVLITWKNKIIEKYKNDDGVEVTKEIFNYETFTSGELENLNKMNITRVIDFLTVDPSTLKNILDWDDKLVDLRQHSIILQEAGIELSDLDIFRSDHIEHLREIGMVTIEDLYFTAKEENWDSDIIPFGSIQTIKDVLHLDLINAREELGIEMVELLQENSVDKILDLYLTGDPILEQKTGLPAERFENLKFALDVGALIQVFDKSVLFTPGLTYFQCLDLLDKGYMRIIDVVLGDNQEISNILKLQKEEIDLITDGINRDTVMRSETETGLNLKDIQVFSRSEIRSISKSGIFEMNELDTLQEVIHQVDVSSFQGEKYLLDQVLNLKKVVQIKLHRIGDLNGEDVKLLSKHGINTIADVLFVGFEDLISEIELLNSLNNVTKSVVDLRPFMAIGKLHATVAMREGEYDGSLLDAWIENIDGLHSRAINSLRSLLSIPITFTKFISEYLDSPEKLEDKTVGDIVLEYYPDEYSPEALLRAKINKRGALIQLLKEGSSPISLLSLLPSELRALLKDSITTIERLITKDPKYLISVAGNTQKFWKEIKDIFSPDVFNARLEDIGLPFSLFGVSAEQKSKLEELDIEYIEQLLYFENVPDELIQYYRFLFASTTFLIGTPGEKELAENLGAQNIIESSMAFRKNGAMGSLIKETIQIAWSAYINYAIPINIKNPELNKLFTLQDLASYVNRGENVTKSWIKNVEQVNKSLLFLPFKPNYLKTMINEHRCTTIIDTLTSPMIFGEIDKFRTKLKQGEDIYTIDDIYVPINIISKINKANWNRLNNLNFSLQNLLSSPRTLHEYNGVKIKFIQMARNNLKIPISRLHINDRQILYDNPYSSKLKYLEDVLYYLPSIYLDNPELSKNIIEVISSDDLRVVKSISIPEELKNAARLTFNSEIDDFQSLYSASEVSSKMLKLTGTNSAINVRDYIIKSLRSVSCIDGITPVELWNLWKFNIRTIADLLLSPVNLGILSQFTNKRVVFFNEVAMSSLNNNNSDESLSIKSLIENFLGETNYRHSFTIANLLCINPHPLIVEQLSMVPDSLNYLLKSSIYRSDFANNLDLLDIKKIYNLGIKTIGDFLFYPEKLDGLPESMRSIDSRLELMKKSYKDTRVDIELEGLNLPSELTDILDESDDTVIHLLDKLLSPKFSHLKSVLSIRLQYSNFNESQIILLKNNNFNTIFDLLLVSPSILSSILEIDEDDIVDSLSTIDLSSITNRLASSPLQISSIEELSKNTIIKLEEHNLKTLLDLSLPIEFNINKSDSNFLTSIVSILSSDLSTLVSLKGIDDDTIKFALENQLTLVKDVIRNFDLFEDSKIQSLLKNIKVSQLNEAAEGLRRLSDLDGIVVKDDKILNTNSIYTFTQLINQSSEFINGIGLEADKYNKIIESLSQEYTQIVGLTEDQIRIAGELSIDTVAAFLSHKQLFSLELTKPIKIKLEIRLKSFFKDNKFDILTEKNINSLTSFMKSKTVKNLIKEGNEEIIEIVGTLNLSINKLPKLKSGWLHAFNKEGIYRIYQYLLSDLQLLSKITDTSYVSQENYLNGLDLTSLLRDTELTLPFDDSDKGLFGKFGIKSLSELSLPDYLQQFIKLEPVLSEKLDRYISSIKSDIWNSSYYWSIDESTRVIFANIGDKVIDLLSSKANILLKNENPDHINNILNTLVKDDTIDVIPLEEWMSDSNISILNEQQILNIHSLIFQSYKENKSIFDNFIFRNALNAIPCITIKQIIKGYTNGITHISDLYFLTQKDIISKLGVVKSKIPQLIEDIKNTGVSTTKLPDIAFYNKDILENLKNANIYSWAQLIGNIRFDELDRVSGFTAKSRINLIERINVPIWYIQDIRNLGVSRLKKITISGCHSILHLLLLGEKIKDVFKEDELIKFYSGINVSTLNKGAKHLENKLSISSKIRVGDIKLFNEIGIHSPVDIIIGAFKLSKNSPLIDGTNDWIRLGELPIDRINFPDDAIVELKKNKIFTVADAIVVSNDRLRDSKCTNKQIRDFRETLNRKKGGKTTPMKKDVKKTVPKKSGSTKTASKPAKKITSKKSTGKKATKKSGSTKTASKPAMKITSKKSTGKKSTKKSSSTKTASKPAKKITSKKPTGKKPTKKSSSTKTASKPAKKTTSKKPTGKKPTKKKPKKKSGSKKKK